MVLTSACNNENGIDEDPEIELSTEILEQTTWKATRTVYDYDGKEYVSHYMLQFLTEKSGTGANLDKEAYGQFSYSIDKRLFTLSGVYTGDYTIMKATKDKIVLQNYSPERVVIIMEKQY